MMRLYLLDVLKSNENFTGLQSMCYVPMHGYNKMNKAIVKLGFVWTSELITCGTCETYAMHKYI